MSELQKVEIIVRTVNNAFERVKAAKTIEVKPHPDETPQQLVSRVLRSIGDKTVWVF